MSFWFARAGESQSLELIGPYEHHDEAIDAFDREKDACRLTGIFCAYDVEYAQRQLSKSFTTVPTRDVSYVASLTPSPQRNLPIHQRDAYKLGLRGRENPYPITSEEFNDFERAKYKRRR